MSKLAEAIARFEGYGRPGAIPTVRHNPGDLRHSLHSSHEGIGPNDIGIIDNDADGWSDLDRQLRLYASRGLTLAQAIHEFAPPTENDTDRYLKFVCEQTGHSPDTPLTEVLA